MSCQNESTTKIYIECSTIKNRLNMVQNMSTWVQYTLVRKYGVLTKILLFKLMKTTVVNMFSKVACQCMLMDEW